MQKKFKQLEQELNSILVNRTDEIHAMILAFISGTHCVMLGTPGTAKSYMVRKFAEAFDYSGKDGSIPYFEVALNNFTKPEDVFGAVDIQKWKSQSVLTYKSENFLPNARIAFIDELSRGEAVLNSLLTILNERTFNVNGTPNPVPLEMAISATNFKLNAREAEALRDRFLQWLNPKEVDVNNQADMLKLWTSSDGNVTVRFTESEVEQMRKEFDAVQLDASVLEVYRQLILELRKIDGNNIVLSDRRTKAILKLIKAEAWLNGRNTIEVQDMSSIWTACWTDEEQISKVKSKITKMLNIQKYRFDQMYLDVKDKFDKYNDATNKTFTEAKRMKKELEELMAKAETMNANDTEARSSKLLVLGSCNQYLKIVMNDILLLSNDTII